MSSENRREYLRAKVFLPTRLSALCQDAFSSPDEGDAGRVPTENVIAGPIDEIIDQMATGSQEETLYRCLKMIDKKLNFVIEELISPSNQSGSTFNDVVELSGSGLKFLSDTAFPEGTLLRMELIMPTAFEFKIDLIARVLRVEKLVIQGKANDESYSVAVHFTEIDEKARDAIIETVFKKPRKLIRLQKERGEE
ncbi:MAG: PilZ domain-containing protein [Deltaproteobacteria bacterium]